MLPSLGGGSQQLGLAQGQIRIDTSGLQRAVADARRAGRDIERSLGGTAARGVQTFQRSINNMRRELMAIGAVSGLATVFGLGSARELRNYRIAFEAVLGSQKEADTIMASLTESANEYGLELGSVLGLGRQILPILEGNTEQTEEWVKRAARLRTVFPGAQTGAELRAISEFLAGQERSLIRLFNIPPSLVQEAKAQFEDVGRQLDFILDRMGATEQAAQDMANPIVSIKNELRLIAAVGFTPLLEDMRELLPEFREWLSDLRETQPELLKIGAGLTAATAAAAPLALVLNQILGSLQKLKSLGILAALGKTGLVAGVGVGGMIGAREGLQAVGRARDDDRLANIRIRDMLFTAAMAIVDVSAILSSALGFVAAKITSAFGTFFEAMGSFAARVADFVPGFLGGDELRAAGEELSTFGRQLRETTENEDLPRFVEEVADARNRLHREIGIFLGIIPDPMTATAAADVAHLNRGAMDTGGAAGGAAAFSEEEMARIEAWNTFQSDLRQIEADAQAERLEATRQYESQRTEIIAQYEQQIAREAEDFNRRRARENAQLEADIADIQSERAEREAEWQEDLNERIAEIQADAAKQRERMHEDHRDNLLSAAARLDAAAVAEEQRRFNRQITRFEEDLQERIDAEREAHEERVQQAREAEQERIDDLREAVAERQAIEDEERAIRLERMEEDHEAQLDKMDDAHQARLRQIDAQERKEKAQRRRQFTNEMIQLSDHYDDWLLLQNERQQDSLDAFEDYFDEIMHMQNQLGMDPGVPGPGGDGDDTGTDTESEPVDPPSRSELRQMAIGLMREEGYSDQAIFQWLDTFKDWTDAQLAQWIEDTFDTDVPGYRFGTPFVPQTGLAMLHRGEAVIDPRMAEVLRRGLGRNFTPQQLAGATGGGADSGGFSGQVTVEVHPAPGMDEAALARMTRRELENLFRSLL